MTEAPPGEEEEKKEQYVYTPPKGMVIAENRSMFPSGGQGGSPVLSKQGKQTISSYICFSNGVKYAKSKPKF